MHAVVPKNTLWKTPVLKVFFLGEQTKWSYHNSTLQSWMIMDIVKKGWDMDGIINGKYVPRFEQASNPYEAQIRVKFQSKFGKMIY